MKELKADRPHPPTHRQIPRTDYPSLFFAAPSKADPLISTAARQKFDFDLGRMEGRYQVHYLPVLRSIKSLTVCHSFLRKLIRLFA